MNFKKIMSLMLALIMCFSITAPAVQAAENYPLNSIVIKIEDAVTHSMLPGARFEIYYSNDQMSGGYGTLIATVDSDSSGVIVISGVPSGYYIVRQTVPPNNYHLSINNEQHCYIKPDGTSVEELVFSNYRYGGLVVILNDKDTGAPIGGATFSVTDVENKVVGTSADGIYTTDSKGEFYLENLPAGDYKITQLTAAQGYAMDSVPNSRTVRLQHTNADQSVFRATFENSPLGTLLVRLKDSANKAPLAGGVFNVKLSGGADLGEFTTGAEGTFMLPKIARGTYIITQVSAPAGYELRESTKTQYVNYVHSYAVDFENSAKSGLQIIKTDVHTHAPLMGATFVVERDTGERIGTYKTDVAGKIIVPGLEAGTYIVSETIAPEGYILDSLPQTVVVKSNTLTVAEFTNKPFSGIEILKTGTNGTNPLIGAIFTIERPNGERIGKYTTDVSGKIVVHGLAEGVYIVSEVQAPDGYLISSLPQTVEVKSGKLTIVEFTNKELPNLYIRKTDADTGELLAGAEFLVEKNGVFIAAVVSSSTTAAVVPRVQPGIYTITETKAPAGYELNDPVRVVEVTATGDVYYNSVALTGNTVTFGNNKLNSLEIVKLDSVTHNPLSGAMFDVTKANGEKIGSYRTDASGKILIPDLTAGTYVVSETAAPNGYILSDSPKSVNISGGKLVSVEFLNKPMSGIEIVKLDAVTHQPLKGAAFTVTKADGERIGTYKTEADGKVLISGLTEGSYIVSETIAPDGYILDNTPQTVTVKSGKLTTAEFTNKPFSGIEIRKVDSVSGNALSGAIFEIRKQDGAFVAEVTTDNGGKASAPSVEPGWYTITETKAPTGYVIDGAAKTVEVKSGVPTVVTVSNKPLSGIEILKLNSVTKAPLMGATFTVERDNGEKIGTYKTDSTGKIIVSGLTEGTYIVSETIAPDGYILDAQPQTVIVKSGKLTAVEFTNKPLAGLQIVKLDSVTRQPIANTEFTVAKMSGERVGTFKTDKAGTIYVSTLEPGWYVVTEVKAASGYIIDSEPKNVEITTGKSTTLEVLNTPMSGLLIVKTDEATKKPLAGVKFEVKKPSGEQVGIFTTDISGQIRLTDVPAGKLIVVETQTLDGYELDTTAREVTIYEGKQTTLEVTNTQKAGLRLLKIDSITKKPIYNVEFMVFDSNNKQVGTFITDNNGIIDFTGILSEGRYTIRETRPAAGYYTDDMPRTIEFKSGKVTEVVWENTPQAGQIQITKLSGDDNEVNGLPKGTPLAGAIFEIYEYKSGNLVDRFVSGTDGRAVSKPLPLGRYTVKEVQAPQWYKLSTEVMDIEVEFATQIIKREFYNYSANTGVKIKKTGNYEAMPGDTITYSIKEIGNTSTVPLTDFFWRDIIPTDAARLTKIVTGTYNQSLKYKVIVTTNKGDTRVIADNLSTTVNNVIDCRNAALGLASDEYVTSFTLVFGTVKAGFCKVLEPQVFMSVKTGLANGYQFANKVDVGGKYGSEWVVGASSWVTQIYAKPTKLPRTGY